ncbi:1-phosphatidylinositol-4-phosphate 5-kinase [Sugiyamaella lignohabitans]|uniref:1-phosphatidylinositol-4-phosphate 5-kinase n=1 Tax=Sugiyamaella lignohabitans TaxID=796027 RepID=A0A167D9A6_9ASCO|nr:1-phosphatidylinositol-4-phosphate 5-kinase [Sugiyamaella lignohabitans]ANB12639.1 1-phosphatidylinositol-4-phosphate 5-kinase [Sugiyamaella lignohabitans]
MGNLGRLDPNFRFPLEGGLAYHRYSLIRSNSGEREENGMESPLVCTLVRSTHRVRRRPVLGDVRRRGSVSNSGSAPHSPVGSVVSTESDETLDVSAAAESHEAVNIGDVVSSESNETVAIEIPTSAESPEGVDIGEKADCKEVENTPSNIIETDGRESLETIKEEESQKEEEVKVVENYKQPSLVTRALASYDQFKLPRLPKSNDSYCHGSLANIEQETPPPVKLSAFNCFKKFITGASSHSPADSVDSVESNVTLGAPEEVNCNEFKSSPYIGDDPEYDTLSDWSPTDFEKEERLRAVSEYDELFAESGEVELMWEAPADAWSFYDAPTPADVEETDDSSDVKKMNSFEENISLLTSLLEEIDGHKAMVQRSIDTGIPIVSHQTWAEAEAYMADPTGAAPIEPQSPVCSDSSFAESDSSLASSEPESQATVFDNISVEEVRKSKTPRLFTRVKAMATSVMRKVASRKTTSISRSTLMFNGVKTATYANPPCEDGLSDFTLESKNYRLDGGAILEVHSPIVYQNIRSICGIDHHRFLNSFVVQSEVNETKSPGQSGSDFLFTSDGKYIIKTIRRKEHKVIANSDFLADYYENIMAQPDTQLPYYLGHYTILLNGKRSHFVVMENLLHKKTKLVYDLKGSSHGKRAGVRENNSGRVVCKDLDWTDKDQALHSDGDQRESSYCINFKMMLAYWKNITL